MTQQIINVGDVANDGQGDSLRTAFIKTNDNFTELYEANVVSVTGNITGGNIITSGVVQAGTVTATGNVATGSYFVGNGALLTGITGTVANVLSTLSVTGNINTGNLRTAGLVTASGNVITASYFIGNGSQMSGVVATSVGTLTSLSVTGNTQSGNLLTAGLMSSTGNVTGGNILTAGLISAAANITGGNIDSAGLISTSSNVVANIATANTVNAVALSMTGNVISVLNVTYDVTSAGNVTAVANIVGANVNTAGLITATGNIQGGNIRTAGLISATGNIQGGNILAAGLISATSTITSAANITGSNLLTGGLISATSSITGGTGLFGTTTNAVYDSVGVARAGVFAASNTSTTINSSTAALAIVNNDTTTNNWAQLNFAAVTGASTNQYSSGIIAVQFGARTNAQYPTGTMTFSTSSSLNAAPSEKMRIDSSGNVGIGTSSPSYPLTVVSNSNGVGLAVYGRSSDSLSGAYWFSNTGANTYGTILASATEYRITSTPAAAVQTFYTNATERMRIDSSGGVGIGTASPDTNAKLTVTGGSIGFGTDGSGTLYAPGTAAAAGWNFYNSYISGVTNNTEQLRILSSGNVGIGNTAPTTALGVTGAGYFSGNVTGGNILTGGLISAAGTVTGTSHIGSVVSVTGSVYGGAFVASGATALSANVANVGIELGLLNAVNTPYIDFHSSGNATTDYDARIVASSGNVGGVNGTGILSVVGATLAATGAISAVGNVTGGNLRTAGLITATGNITGGNISTGGLLSATGNTTVGNIALTGSYTEGVVVIGTVVGNSAISLSSGTVQTATLTASTACTFTMPTATAGKSFMLFLKQAASTGNGTATFSGVKWNASGTPIMTATAGKMDIFSFTSDGTNWYGTASQGYTP